MFLGLFITQKQYDAVRNGRSKAVTFLLSHGANPNIEDKWGETPIFDAVRVQDTGSFQALLEVSHLTIINNKKQTLLHIAAEFGTDSMVTQLLETLDPDGRDKFGKTPLHRAATSGKVKNAQIIISHTKDPFVRTRTSKSTPLHTAAKYGRVGFVRYYLRLDNIKDHINDRDTNGETPRVLALRYAHRKTLDLLTINGGTLQKIPPK